MNGAAVKVGYWPGQSGAQDDPDYPDEQERSG